MKVTSKKLQKSFMNNVIKMASAIGINCTITTDAGTQSFDVETANVTGSDENLSDTSLKVIRKHSTKVDVDTARAMLELSNKEDFRFEDVIKWMMRNRNELMNSNNTMEYYFIAATNVVLSVRFHNIDHREIWIYTSQSMNLNKIKPFAIVKVLVDQETFDPTGNVSIMSIDNGIPIEESEIIMKSSEKLNGIRWWDGTRYKNVFSTVELVLTALLCMDINSLVPLSKKDDVGV